MSEPTTDVTDETDVTRATDVTDETDVTRATDVTDETGVEVHRTAGRKVVLGLLRAYQGARAGKLSPCRFYPSCSAYAVEAVERHGAWRGSLLAIRRLSRCRPLGGSGIDLVPLEVRHHRRAR